MKYTLELLEVSKHKNTGDWSVIYRIQVRGLGYIGSLFQTENGITVDWNESGYCGGEQPPQQHQVENLYEATAIIAKRIRTLRTTPP